MIFEEIKSETFDQLNHKDHKHMIIHESSGQKFIDESGMQALMDHNRPK